MAPVGQIWIPGDRLWQWRQQAQQAAIAAQIPLAELDWLLRETTALDGLSLRLASFRHGTVNATLSLDELDSLWQRRLTERMPVQYLIGQPPWRDFTLQVSPAVLIPRPETELIIDLAVDFVRQLSPALGLEQGAWVDLGTGSGAIAIGLAKVLPAAWFVAVDVSAEAIAIAQTNAIHNGVSDRIEFRQGSWFEPLADLQGQVAAVVSNPPYIPTAVVSTLAPEVAHEPGLALDGGSDGLGSLKTLAAESPRYLLSGGLWLAEMMEGQAEWVRSILQTVGCYHPIQVHPDLTGRDRFVSARLL